MKAVLQFRAGPGFQDQIAKLAPNAIDVVIVEEADRERFAVEMRGADFLLHVLEPVTADVIAAAPKLKLIQKIGVGVNTIDLDAAAIHGVAVANMPGTNSQAVAEMTLSLMLATLRRVPLLDQATRAGQGWSLEEDTFDTAGEVSGKTVGLVGYGEVPKRLAPVLINTARGGLVDEEALLSALISGHLKAAGLDTVAVEPAGADNPLFALENVVVTPHIAWLTPETLGRSLGIAFENCQRIAAGKRLLNQIELSTQR